MGVDEAVMGAPREATSAVSGSQCPLHCWRHRACFTSDVERIARVIIGYSQQAAIAGDAAGGIRREALPAFESCRYRRQIFQRVRGTNLFARCVQADAASPVEPVCAGLPPGTPWGLVIQFGDEL